MRYLISSIEKDLPKKLVFLAGPRQVGKSTLVKTLIESKSHYLNWDVSADRKIIQAVGWPKDGSVVVLDELHKYLKWKGFLKGVIDEYGNKPPLIVTGSARLETFRRGGDALTGRTYLYRLHPIDPTEAVTFFKAKDSLDASKKLIQTGGFPEAYLNPRDADRLREDRLQVVVREDLRDLSAVSELRGVQLLIELLRERVGGTVNYSHLASDIGVSPPTVKKWIELLERLYLIYIVYPYSRKLARSIRREPKVYFYDCAAATNGNGYRFENLIGSYLLKKIHFLNDSRGTRYGLSYFRDKEKHEVDFVVTDGLKAKLLVETKLSDDSIGKGLKYLNRMIPEARAVQIVGADVKSQHQGEIEILSVGQLGKERDTF
jgi:uncharacterized protein